MSDKVERLHSLAGRNGEVQDESWEDTLDDLIAYGVLYKARPSHAVGENDGD